MACTMLALVLLIQVEVVSVFSLALSLFSNTKIVTVMTDHQVLKKHFA